MDDVKEMTQKGYTHTHMKTWDSQDFSIGPSPLKSRFTEKNGSPTWRIYVYSLCHAMWCSPMMLPKHFLGEDSFMP